MNKKNQQGLLKKTGDHFFGREFFCVLKKFLAEKVDAIVLQYNSYALGKNSVGKGHLQKVRQIVRAALVEAEHTFNDLLDAFYIVEFFARADFVKHLRQRFKEPLPHRVKQVFLVFVVPKNRSLGNSRGGSDFTQ